MTVDSTLWICNLEFMKVSLFTWSQQWEWDIGSGLGTETRQPLAATAAATPRRTQPRQHWAAARIRQGVYSFTAEWWGCSTPKVRSGILPIFLLSLYILLVVSVPALFDLSDNSLESKLRGNPIGCCIYWIYFWFLILWIKAWMLPHPSFIVGWPVIDSGHSTISISCSRVAGECGSRKASKYPAASTRQCCRL